MTIGEQFLCDGVVESIFEWIKGKEVEASFIVCMCARVRVREILDCDRKQTNKRVIDLMCVNDSPVGIRSRMGHVGCSLGDECICLYLVP